MKKVLSVILAICMVVGLLPAMMLGASAADPAGEMTIYFQNNWLWTDVRLYYWGSTDSNPAWPGNAMEKVGNDGNYDIYKATVPTNVTGIIINGLKDDGSGSRDQTPDIESGWYDGICYWMQWNSAEAKNAVGSENIDVILPPPAAPNVDNVNNAIYVFVCNTQLPAGQFHQATGIAFDSNYSEAGEPVKNADGKWIAEVTCKVKAMWENHTSKIYEYNYPDHAHTPHDELPETLTVTLTWDPEAEEWVCDNDDVTYDISCASAEPSYVAEVDGQGFEALAEALAYAQTVEGSTLKLLKNVSLDTPIHITGGKFTIDLNGFVWENSTNPLYVWESAEVKLTSTAPGGVIRCTTNIATIQVLDTASLEIAGGTVENTGEGFAVDLSLSGMATDARLLISGGRVTANGSAAIWAFGNAVTVTGGILESRGSEIGYLAGIIELSDHPDPTGIGIEIGYTITEAIVGTDVLLPVGYCLMDASTGEPATTLVTYGKYTVAADSASAANVAEVDGQGFETLAEAIAYAETVDGSTLKLLQNVSLDTYIDITGGKFTIDLNGFVWERSGYVLYVQGTADVKLTSSAPGGVIRGTAAGCPTVLVMNASYMEINGGTVEHTAQGLAIDTSAGGNPTEARLLISGGKVTTNGYLAIKAFGSAVTVTGGILESALYEIQYYTGTIDLSGHTNPTGIGIKIGYNVTEVAVGTDILLPAGYCLMDDSTGEPATTLVDGGQYTVAAESATPEPATVTGVSFSGNGVTFDAETNTYYVSSDATDITVTITGTNFANLTEEYFVNFAYNGIIVILECYVDVENNIASFTRADASEFFGSDGHELYYFTDGGATWTNLGVYVTYVDSTELTYSVVGSFNGWETSDTAYDMTLGADGKYTLTKELPAGTYDFKIVKNHAWEVNYGCGTSVENGVTYNLELGGFDASFTLDADAEVTFIFDLAAQTITVSWEETSSTPEPATVTGVSFSGNGVTFDAETNTYYISVDATDITMTVTGTNFAQLTENYYVQFAARTRVAIDELFMDVDVENNLATRADLPVGGFEGSDGNEIRYTTDGGETWTGLGIYVTYVEDTSPDYATKAELEAAIAELQQLINQLEQTYGIEVPALQDALTALQQQVAALDDTYATDEDVKALGDELNALIQRVTDLENTYATKTELEAAIAELQQQINALAAYGADITQLKSDLTALQQQVAALDGTYATDEDVKALSDELNSLIQRVTALENTYATKAELEAEIARLEQLIADLELAYGADNAGLAAELATLQQQLTDLQTALNALDDTYVNETQLIDAVNTINQSITDLASRVAALEATYATKAELEEAIKILNEAIAAGDATAAEALAEAVSKLEKALADAVAALETADAENKAALEAMIAEAKAALEEAIAQLRSDLEDAVEDLENADKENAEALAKAIEDLTAVIKAVEAASAAEDAKIREELNRAKASLYASIAKLTTDLETAKTELTAAIANGDAALDQKIAELSAALNAAIAASNAADEALKTELSAAIADGDAALQAAIDAVAQNLTKAEEELNAAIAAGDKDLDDKIAALNAALEAAIAASDAADGALNTRIDEAVAALNAAIAQVQKNLDEAKAELTEKDAQLEAKDAQLNKLSVAALVIACVGVAGCLALLVYIIIDKRKKK